MAGERLLTLPNALTFARLPLAALVWLAPGSRAWLLVILAAAAATDVLDGRIARARRAADGEPAGERGAIGAWLDPLCDKLFVLSVLAAVAFAFRPPAAQLALIAAREILLAPFVVSYAMAPAVRRLVSVDFRAAAIGKAATVAQFAAVLAIVLAPRAAPALAILAALVGAAATTHYLRRVILATRRRRGRP